MPNMEKAGIIVVGALIAIIVAVGLLNRPANEKTPSQDPDVPDRVETKKDEKFSEANRPESPKPLVVTPSPDRPVNPGPRPITDNGRRIDGTDAPRPTPGPDNLSDSAGGKTLEPAGEWPKEYVVKDGDHYTRIATQIYDDPSLSKMIEKANPAMDPRRLKAGDKLTLPAPPARTDGPVAQDGGTVVPDDVMPSPDGDAKVPSAGTKPAPKSIKSGPVRSRSSESVKRPAFITSEYVKANLASLSSNRTVGATAKKGGGKYTIKAGDTIESIARRQLGSVRFAAELKKANPVLLKDDKKLRTGAVLNLPKVN